MPAGAVRGLNCPSCGAAVALRGMDWTQTVACASCGAVLDARDPALRILQAAAARRGPEPLVPLGARGQWRGAPYEVIGFQERANRADGARYAWREYVLFNPYRGFRYLTEYDGHWNDVVPLPAPPALGTHKGRPSAEYQGRTYRHFQTARATTDWVLGEFPWEARTGDVVEARDYVAPPYVLSAEASAAPDGEADADGGVDEVTWSHGTYVDGAEVWRAFGVPGAPPPPRGVYANQPSPHAGAGRLWPVFRALALLLAAGTAARCATARDAEVFATTATYQPGAADPDAAAGATAFVTPPFDVPPGRVLGGGANVELRTDAPLDNNWMLVTYTLVDEGTGRAYDVQRELDYYSGTDPDDGSRWTDGSRRDRVRLGPVPPGRYFLRVEPAGGDRTTADSVPLRISVRRDVPRPGVPAVLALVALLLPPGVAAARAAGFEARRWAESDYAPGTSATTGGDEEDDA